MLRLGDFRTRKLIKFARRVWNTIIYHKNDAYGFKKYDPSETLWFRSRKWYKVNRKAIRFTRQ